jgi:uncharacterized membrane protein
VNEPAPSKSGSSRTACLALVLALLALQWLWHGRTAAGSGSGGITFAAVMSLPLALLAGGLVLGRPSARFWAGVAALFYFCHGLAEAWAISASRVEGLVEAALAVSLVVASSWDGLRARFGARPRRNV